jgi:hypothetical protein
VDGFKTKVTPARPNSTSLRTTIPEGVVKTIELKAGNSLRWKIEVRDEQIIVIVEKVS